MKNRVLWVVVLQLLALLAIAGKREWIYLTGDVVYLRTAPVDPRDMFRGDYVELAYDIATPDQSLLATLPTSEGYLPIYAGLAIDHKGVATIKQLSTETPAPPFIKGAIESRPYYYDRRAIHFGIEKYFVEQGSGLALEEQRGRGQDWQTAMEMEVALGSDGTAVIRGHRWSDVGVRLEVVESGRNPWRDDVNVTRKSARLRLSVRNQSTHELQLLDTPQACAWQLISNEYDQDVQLNAHNRMVLPNRDCDNASAWRLIPLAPNAVHAIDIDLAQARWHVDVNDKVQELGALSNNGISYRLLYAPPMAIGERFSHVSTLWLTPTTSARFFAAGNVD